MDVNLGSMTLREFIAAGIAEKRAAAVRDGLKAEMLQRVQLEGGKLVEDEEGVRSVRVVCPACGPDRPPQEIIDRAILSEDRDGALRAALVASLGTIEVEVPYGLTEGRNGRAWLDLTAIDDETLLWAIRGGFVKVEPNTAALRAQADTTLPEMLVMLPKLGAAIHKSESEFVKQMTTKQAEAAR